MMIIKNDNWLLLLIVTFLCSRLAPNNKDPLLSKVSLCIHAATYVFNLQQLS